ncbi:MAG: MXAN_6230/SCO0854 family RING domain-containing protein [Polyangia bacterium]
MNSPLSDTQAVLLRRRGLVFIGPSGRDSGRDSARPPAPLPDDYVKAVEIEWAALGYVPSSRLRARLVHVPVAELAAIRDRVAQVLAKQLGAHVKHQPLFRRFPDDIPGDTAELWLRKVLSHFLQGAEQPCLFCRAVGTTHVLSPCLHVVCDRCFDGTSYSACPVCEHHVDPGSPFFRPSPEQPPSPREKVQLKLLDLGEDLEAEARRTFVAFCERKQAMSKTDRDDLETLVLDGGARVLGWLPDKIPVKENVALVFGTLFTVVDPAVVLPSARAHLKTATDVLRFLAVLSGADAGLLPQPRYLRVEREVPTSRWWGGVAKLLGIEVPARRAQPVYTQIKTCRFRMAKLGRPLRRALLELLEGFAEDALTEDMLRHRSRWVWAGEFLHPHEYAKRFPKVARAFAVVRKFAPDGTPAPRYRGFYARLESAAERRDAPGLLKVLRERPGELGRRFDHALRIAGEDERAAAEVVRAFVAVVPRLSTPLLLLLSRYLPARLSRAETRVYFPRGPVTTGVSAPDERPLLMPQTVTPAVTAITAELLQRFAAKPQLEQVILDTALTRIPVPFNERTASRAAVALPRGSVVQVPREKLLRLFLHWCQPQRGGQATDIDLSVGFYDEAWREIGVCSYYQLRLNDARGAAVAQSGGDLRDAPFPDGASELIDLDWPRALAHGIRYAVMVVNNYSGMPFSLLERGFAGLMLRSDPQGAHFDPRTVELKFDLQGDNGIYLPLVLDLKAEVLHWLDAYSNGQLAFNNVASSRRAITRICPTLMRYFTSGVRPTLYELGLLHAAARCRTVYLRDPSGAVLRFERGTFEEVPEFHARLVAARVGAGGGVRVPEPPAGGREALALLHRGDLELSPETARYVLFPGRIATTLSASDLLS